MRGAGGCGRGASRLAAAKRRLLRAAALGALASSGALTGVDAAWGQISETLPEVTVSAPRPVPRLPRRPPPAPRRAASSAPATSEPVPAPAVSAPSPFQFVAPTPITGLGIDRSKVPAMVQTLPAEDFSRTYSPNVVETFVQRIPGVTTNNVQGNEFATDLRYRGFAASRLRPCRARRRGSPSTCRVSASTRPSATPSTGT
jgi:outer membrane receptor protein involved in Fe transport